MGRQAFRAKKRLFIIRPIVVVSIVTFYYHYVIFLFQTSTVKFTPFEGIFHNFSMTVVSFSWRQINIQLII